MQEHIFPISNSLNVSGVAAPETLRELVEHYKGKKLNFDKQHRKLDLEEDFKKETSIFDHLASNIFILITALISLIVAIIVIMLSFKGAKM